MMNSKSHYWVVKSKTDGDFIGLVDIGTYHDGVNKELSYQLLPEYWGYGLAAEIIKRIINYAFEELNIEKIIAETQTKNIRSCWLLERVGMQLTEKIVRFGEEQSVYCIINISKT